VELSSDPPVFPDRDWCRQFYASLAESVHPSNEDVPGGVVAALFAGDGDFSGCVSLYPSIYSDDIVRVLKEDVPLSMPLVESALLAGVACLVEEDCQYAIACMTGPLEAVWWRVYEQGASCPREPEHRISGALLELAGAFVTCSCAWRWVVSCCLPSHCSISHVLSVIALLRVHFMLHLRLCAL